MRLADRLGRLALVGLVLVLVAGGAIQAQEGPPRHGPPDRPGLHDRAQRTRPILGEVIELTDQGMVIRPHLPPEIAKKLREKGRSLPPLPEKIEVIFADQVRFVDSLEGGPKTVNPFSEGDEVVVFGRRSDRGLVAFRVVDAEVARAYFERMKERGGERRAKIEQALKEKFAWGKASIKEISEGKITLSSDKPELMGEFEIGERTIFLVENQWASLDDFSTGQLVSVLIYKEKGAIVMLADETTDFRRAMGRLLMAMAKKHRQEGAGKGEHGWPKARLGRARGK